MAEIIRTFPEKDFYTISEVCAMTGMGREQVKATFPLETIPGYKAKKIRRGAIDDWRKKMRQGADDTALSDLPDGARKDIEDAAHTAEREDHNGQEDYQP